MKASRLRGGLGVRAITILGGAMLIAGCAGLPKPVVAPAKRLIVATRQSDPVRVRAMLDAKEPRGPKEGFIPLSGPRPERGLRRPVGALGTGPERNEALVSWTLVDLEAAPVKAEIARAATLKAAIPAAPGAVERPALPPGEASLGWDAVYSRLQDEEAPTVGLLGMAERELDGEIVAIEPEVEVSPPGEWETAPVQTSQAPQAPAPAPPAAVPAGKVDKGPSTIWPRGEIAWHLGPQYTQLDEARDLVRAKVAAEAPRVRVAHIDTGHAPLAQVTTPARLPLNLPLNANFWDVKKKGEYIPGDAQDRLTGTWESLRKAGFFAMPGHGAATLGVLAGREIDVDAGKWGTLKDALGGAPDADVFCVRVSPTVVHLDSTRLAKAIDYAVEQGADVISLSHGGLPSRYLTEAVNNAYENGTAIFAAASDFFELPPLVRLFLPAGAPRRSPSRTMWPASYETVMSVAGVTKEGRSYALSPGFWKSFLVWKWPQWMLRGSYGPESVMDHTIASYAPNIPFARYTKAGQPLDRIDLNGGGTSAATPQVAAAAALWLQLHREELKDGWRSWEKVENVYAALSSSAKKVPGTPDDEQRRYFGAGVLQAKAALEVAPSSSVAQRAPATVDVPDAFATILLSAWVMPDQLPARSKGLLWSSVALEVAQIAALDGRVGEALDALRVKGLLPERKEGLAEGALDPLRTALKESRHASGFLRTWL